MTKPTKEQIRKIFEYWNTKEITIHRSIDKHERHIVAALKHYSVVEISSAIANYAIIIKSSDYYWSYAWTLKDFLCRGLDRFVSENDPFKNFKSATADSTITEIGDLIDPPDEDKNFKERFLEAKKERTK